MAVVGTMAFLVIPAFIAGIIAAMVFNYIALVKWRNRDKPHKQRWYHTWHRH